MCKLGNELTVTTADLNRVRQGVPDNFIVFVFPDRDNDEL